MKNNRSAGILLHPSCLPGPDGIGDFGPEAYRFVNFVRDSGCTLWQVLPLGPTGYGDHCRYWALPIDGCGGNQPYTGSSK